MIWVGTSGFQFPEWKGTFYPSDLAVKKMLGNYAAHFPTTEINYSFYRIPSVMTLSNWSTETPGPSPHDRARFAFAIGKERSSIRQD